MEGVSVMLAGAVAAVKLAESQPPVGPPAYAIVPTARPLSVPVPLFVTVTVCAAGLAAPAVAEKFAAADDSEMAGAAAGGCVVPPSPPLLPPPPLQASAPALASKIEIRRMQPRTGEWKVWIRGRIHAAS